MWNIATDVLVKRVRIICIGDYTLISLFVNEFVIMQFFLIFQKLYKGLSRRTKGLTECIQARAGSERGP